MVYVTRAMRTFSLEEINGSVVRKRPVRDLDTAAVKTAELIEISVIDSLVLLEGSACALLHNHSSAVNEGASDEDDAGLVDLAPFGIVVLKIGLSFGSFKISPGLIREILVNERLESEHIGFGIEDRGEIRVGRVVVLA